jgi:hypothetical protein
MRSVIAIAALAGIAAAASAQTPIIISGFMANPASTDSPFEYIQLIATQTINFATTPYSVVACNNGAVGANTWFAGGALSYGFNITSGTVNAGDVFYVGGSGQTINGSGSTSIAGATWLRSINTGTTAGDGFGASASAGVIGNGGSNADGIAVFTGLAGGITNASVPVDNVFYGTAVGTARNANGYRVRANDLYAGGLFGDAGNTFLASDPGGGAYVRLTGTYNNLTNSWTTGRSSGAVSLTSTSQQSDIATGITIVPTPGSAALMGMGLLAAARRRRA